MAHRRIMGLRDRLIPFAVLALAWEILARTLHNHDLYPTFEYLVTVSFPSLGMFYQGSGFSSALIAIGYNGWITMVRVLAGLACGIPLGVAGGLLLHFLRGSGPVSAVILTALRSIPLLALIPLFKYWFGLAPSAMLIYIALGTFFVISSDAYEAAANMTPVYLQQARLLGADSATVLRTVYLPGIRQQLAGGLRNVIGLSWAFSLGAEYISASDGLGYMTYQAYSNSNMGQLAVMALIYAGLGYGSYEVTQLFIRGFAWWKRSLWRRII